MNCVGQPLFVSESTGTSFDGIEATVDAFCRTVAGFENDRVNDSPRLRLDGLGRLFHWFKPATHGPGKPSHLCFERPSTIDKMPQFVEQFLDGPCLGRCQRTGRQLPESVLLSEYSEGSVPLNPIEVGHYSERSEPLPSEYSNQDKVSSPPYTIQGYFLGVGKEFCKSQIHIILSILVS